MKAQLLLLAALVCFCGCRNEVESATTEAVPVEPVAMQIEVPNMVCESCVAKVTEVMNKQPGVANVAVDLQSKLATLEVNPAAFDSQAAIDTLRDYQFDGASVVEEVEAKLRTGESASEDSAPETADQAATTN